MNTTIVIPCCGLGTRMGSDLPKPLVPVKNKPLIEWAVQSLNGLNGRLIFIILKEHDRKFDLRKKLLDLFDGCSVILLDHRTDGAARTVLQARHLFDKNSPLVISNCDQYYEWDSVAFRRDFEGRSADGATLVFNSDHPKWSYVRLDEEGLVAEVAEKKAISNLANVGSYWYRKGKFFVDAAHRMIAMDDLVNGEFYIAPTFNHMIFYGARVIPFKVDRMIGLGTADDIIEAKTKLPCLKT